MGEPNLKYHSTILGGADMGGCYEVDCVLGYKGFMNGRKLKALKDLPCFSGFHMVIERSVSYNLYV